jgi:hypothetical protein
VVYFRFLDYWSRLGADLELLPVLPKGFNCTLGEGKWRRPQGGLTAD